MAQRYCTNCGAQLGDDARFCPSCGRPVQETAAVSTPEADVPVPPPPQETPGAGPQESSERSGGCLRNGIITLLVIIGVLILLSVVGSLLGGGSDQGSGGSGDSGGGAQVAPDGVDQEDQAAQPEPEPAPEPEPEPEPEPKLIPLSGNASQATDFFELEEGLSVFDFSHQGQANFVATLLDEQGTEVAFALGNEIGNIETSSAVRIPQTGRYVLDVDADGPWSATVRQPRPADAPEQTSFSGDNNAATPIFSLSSGLKRVTATHQGQGNFIVTMLDSEGREAAFALVNEIGTGEFSTTATVPQDGLYLFTVEADGPWKIEVE